MKIHLAAFAVLLAACSSAETPDRDPANPAPDTLTGGASGTASGMASTITGTTVTGDGGTTTTTTTGGTTTITIVADGGVLDWQDLYSLYFAPNTIGHCAACHGTSSKGLGGFASGTTADTMYAGLIAAKMIDTTNTAESPLGIPGVSPLSWYNVPLKGATTLKNEMPQDNPVADSQAAGAVTAWVVNGAQNHGVPAGGTPPPGDDDDDAGGGNEDGGKTQPDGGTHDAGSSDAGKGDAGAPGTFSDIYDNWIGPNTPGHCGNSYCHRDTGSRGGSDFVCGTSKSACYSGLVAAGLISTTAPTMSPIGDPMGSPLAWFGQNGPMPLDLADTNAAGAAAITAWVAAGAPNN